MTPCFGHDENYFAIYKNLHKQLRFFIVFLSKYICFFKLTNKKKHLNVLRSQKKNIKKCGSCQWGTDMKYTLLYLFLA